MHSPHLAPCPQSGGARLCFRLRRHSGVKGRNKQKSFKSAGYIFKTLLTNLFPTNKIYFGRFASVTLTGGIPRRSRYDKNKVNQHGQYGGSSRQDQTAEFDGQSQDVLCRQGEQPSARADLRAYFRLQRGAADACQQRRRKGVRGKPALSFGNGFSQRVSRRGYKDLVRHIPFLADQFFGQEQNSLHQSGNSQRHGGNETHSGGGYAL